MSSGILTFSDVAFAFDSARQPILARASPQFPAGWTGIVGADGAGQDGAGPTCLADLRRGGTHTGREVPDER